MDNILVYCFSKWAEQLTACQDTCLKITEILEQLGREVAFPCRTLYMHDRNEDQAESILCERRLASSPPVERQEQT